MLTIALVGANGRMGREIRQAIEKYLTEYHLKYAVVNQLMLTNATLAESKVNIVSSIDKVRDVDVVIDFSPPIVVMYNLVHCCRLRIPIVIGATGFNSAQKKEMADASEIIPVLFSPNMSISVNVLFNLVKSAAKYLDGFEAEIFEAHHRYKKDAPSGTALKLGEVIADARGLELQKYAKFSRVGNDSERTNPLEIGFSVMRGGDIVGTHEISFISNGETLRLTSEITNRSSFAHGALLGAKFITGVVPGLYSMTDVLEL